MSVSANSGPTLRDVAAHAGVSNGTVSHVLNHPEKVSPQTLARVQASIEELGWVRDANARSLAAGGSRSVGLVVIDLGNSVFVDLALGAQQVATANGLNLLLAASQDSFAQQSANVDFFNEARVAGLLLAPMQNSSEQMARFLDRGRPVVLVNYDPGAGGVCSVIVDNEQAGYLAATHLLTLGCRRLMFVHGDLSLQPVRLRLEGFRRAVREAGSGAVLEEAATPDLTVESGRELASRLVGRGPSTRPDGIAAVTDTLASGLIAGLEGQGISVPGDIAVMGCDDNSAAPRVDVSLTTVSMHGEQLGQIAMRLLVEEMDAEAGAHTHQRVVVVPELIVGGSTRGFEAPDS